MRTTEFEFTAPRNEPKLPLISSLVQSSSSTHWSFCSTRFSQVYYIQRPAVGRISSNEVMDTFARTLLERIEQDAFTTSYVSYNKSQGIFRRPNEKL